MGCRTWTWAITRPTCSASTTSGSAAGSASCPARSSGSGTWAARPSRLRSIDTCAQPWTTWRRTTSKLEAGGAPFLDPLRHVAHESRSRQAVDDAVVERHGQVHDRPDDDLVIDNHRALADRLRAEDRGLRLVDDRLTSDRPESAGVIQREGAAAHVVGLQLLVARAGGDVVDGVGEVREAHQVGVFDHRHD